MLRNNSLKQIRPLIFLVILWHGLVGPESGFGKERSLSLVCDPWPPYQILWDGGLSGISVALVRMTLDQMNVRISSIKCFPWKRALKMLEKGNADALFSANFNEGRTAWAHYPDEPLFESPWVFWGPKPDTVRILAWEDLILQRIAVVSGYTYTPAFWEKLKAAGNYYSVTSDEQSFLMLAAGRVDLALAELRNGHHLVSHLKLSGIAPIRATPIKTDGLYMIFNKARVSKSFADRFFRTLQGVKQRAAFKKLIAPYGAVAP